MNRGFNFYYREGLSSSAKAIYKNHCFFRYILYFLAELFGRLLIIFNLHFNLAAVRQGYVLRKREKMSFSSSFNGVGKRVSVSTYLLTLCLEGLIIIAGVVVIAAVAAILGAIGYAVAHFSGYKEEVYFILAFAAPAAPILLIYVLVSLLIFSPTAYVISNNEGVSAGETIGACYRTMANKGKVIIFFSYFVSLLLKSVYLGAFAVGGYFVCLNFIPDKYLLITVIGLGVLALLGYLMFAPILTLTNRVVKEHLFEDIVLDPVTAVRVNEKVNLSICEGKRTDAEVLSQNLASLFEYVSDPYRILEIERIKESELEKSESSKSQKKRARTEKADVTEQALKEKPPRKEKVKKQREALLKEQTETFPPAPQSFKPAEQPAPQATATPPAAEVKAEVKAEDDSQPDQQKTAQPAPQTAATPPAAEVKTEVKADVKAEVKQQPKPPVVEFKPTATPPADKPKAKTDGQSPAAQQPDGNRQTPPADRDGN